MNNDLELLLRAWGTWSNPSSTIRQLTGCGPGPLSEAGPPARRVYGAPATGEVWESSPIDLVEKSALEACDAAIHRLTTHLASIVMAEYKIRGMSQREKAVGLRISWMAYKVGLHKARRLIEADLDDQEV